jgi:hypothetical protein
LPRADDQQREFVVDRSDEIAGREAELVGRGDEQRRRDGTLLRRGGGGLGMLGPEPRDEPRMLGEGVVGEEHGPDLGSAGSCLDGRGLHGAGPGGTGGHERAIEHRRRGIRLSLGVLSHADLPAGSAIGAACALEAGAQTAERGA